MEKKNLHEQLQKNMLNKHQQAAAKGGYRANPTAISIVSVRWDDVVFRFTGINPDSRFNPTDGGAGGRGLNNMLMKGRKVR